MTHYKAKSGNGAACSLSCALRKLVTLNDDNQFLETAKESLSQAVFLMDEYYQTWHSIIWIKSDLQTKKRVSEQLNNLAFDAYQHFCEATKNLNAYVDSQFEKEQKGVTVVPSPAWWNDMDTDLLIAKNRFETEHKHEIYSKQLTLF